MTFTSSLIASVAVHTALLFTAGFYSQVHLFHQAAPSPVIEVEYILESAPAQNADSPSEPNPESQEEKIEVKEDNRNVAISQQKPQKKKITPLEPRRQNAATASKENHEESHASTPPSTQTAPSTGIVKASPNYAINPPPEYPLIARRGHYEGVVMLEVAVDASGNPTETKLKESSNFEVLDKAAIKAVEKWKFTPALSDGVPIASIVVVPIRFKLDGK